ncbi:hypothetical protein HJFPF1_04389 [Paramyrothecium foliicola]|nr:hypothetical protein HJFPF1_04389 [Paramyrothecium foliicola]
MYTEASDIDKYRWSLGARLNCLKTTEKMHNLGRPSWASCLIGFAAFELASGMVLERQACASDNLLRGFKDKRYSAFASPWCSSYISIPLVTSTISAGTATVTRPGVNSNTVTVTETQFDFITEAITVTSTTFHADATTLTYFDNTFITEEVESTETVYTSTSTTTTTLYAAFHKRSVSIPPGLATIISKYSPPQLTSGCGCLSISPSTTRTTIPASTSTVIQQGTAATVTTTQRRASTVTAIYTTLVTLDKVTVTTTRTFTDPVYTGTTTVREVASATRTVCDYTHEALVNPSFRNDDNLYGWRKYGQGLQKTINLDPAVSNDDGSSAARVQYTNGNGIAGLEQNIYGVCPTTWYTLSAWIKTDVSVNCRAVLYISGRQHDLSLVSEPDWHHYTAFVFVQDVNSNRVLFSVYCEESTAANFWLDELSVVQTNPQPPMPASGGVNKW